ncbi:MAG: mandelate racemase/muconate lactonizing enzyme family protein [Protaetiibacter sp.]
MRIDSIAVRLSKMPIPNAPWSDSIHVVTHFEIITVEVTADDGTTGTGYTYAAHGGGRSIATLLRDDVAPHLIGREVAPRRLWFEMWDLVQDLGAGGFTTVSIAALDIAFWDLLGRSLGVPLHALLGSVRDRIPVYGSGINLRKSMDELLDQVDMWVRKGYQGVKIKIGLPEIEQDVERVAKVRERIGALPLMVDANQGFDQSRAIAESAALEPYRLAWFEEPLARDDVYGAAQLRARMRTPLALGENVYTLRDITAFLRNDAVDVVQCDVVRTGGPTAYLQIAALARAYNVPLAPHHAGEISGMVLASSPDGIFVEDVDGGSLSDLRVIRDFRQIRDGWYEQSDAPGHGLELDLDSLRAHELAF